MTDDAAERQIESLLDEVLALSRVLRSEEAAACCQTLELLARNGPRTVPQLGRMRGTSRQNIQILVNRLEREGLVELSKNPAHKRSELVCLTEPGRTALQGMLNGKATLIGTLRPVVANAEVVRARETLQQVRTWLAGRKPSHETESHKVRTRSANGAQQHTNHGAGVGMPQAEDHVTQAESEEFPVNLL